MTGTLERTIYAGALAVLAGLIFAGGFLAGFSFSPWGPPPAPAAAPGPEPGRGEPPLPAAPPPPATASQDARVARGKALFLASCAACHGQDARGIPGIGKDLVGGEFARTATDGAFFEVVAKGRAVDDPGNTTGLPMPPRGGNPNLTDDDIRAIIAYLRSLGN